MPSAPSTGRHHCAAPEDSAEGLLEPHAARLRIGFRYQGVVHHRLPVAQQHTRSRRHYIADRTHYWVLEAICVFYAFADSVVSCLHSPKMPVTKAKKRLIVGEQIATPDVRQVCM